MSTPIPAIEHPPTATWYCDSCDGPITNTGRATLIWREDGMRAYDFQIVHKNIEGSTCDPGHKAGFSSSVDLDHAVDPEDGPQLLLAMLSLGPFHGRVDTMPRVKDFDGWVDLFRRLHTPYYEETRRRYNNEAIQDELHGANEYLPYIPGTMARLLTLPTDD